MSLTDHLLTSRQNEPEQDDPRPGDESEDGFGEATSPSPGPTATTATKRRVCRKPRLPCKKYADVQAYFIWYHRTDLHECWDEVERKFDLQYKEKRVKGGLQCKFYRFLDQHKVEKVREQAKRGQRRHGDRVGRFGVVERTNERHDWM